MASKAATGEAPPERRTIHVIFADPILVAMECVPVSSSSDLKQHVRCVPSVKMKQTGSPSVSPPFLRPGLAAVSFWVEMLWAVGFCGGRDHFNVWPSSPHAFHCV